MDTHKDSSSEIYEVEKIINCKYYRNKKYYLVKWLCYPIYESTWEPKSNLKSLNYMILITSITHLIKDKYLNIMHIISNSIDKQTQTLKIKKY